jgi:hypothetical protein
MQHDGRRATVIVLYTQHLFFVNSFSFAQVGTRYLSLATTSMGTYYDTLGIDSSIEYHGTGADEDNSPIGYQGFEVIIPNGYFSQGTLAIGFKALIGSNISVGYYGIDKVRLVTKCSDPNAMRMLEQATMAAAEPALAGEEESYYCLAQDFPCDGGDDYVNVCHYSARLGYRTFCIPEADSEVLRFYANDYCGPCVGGFAAAAGAQLN